MAMSGKIIGIAASCCSPHRGRYGHGGIGVRIVEHMLPDTPSAPGGQNEATRIGLIAWNLRRAIDFHHSVNGLSPTIAQHGHRISL
jgi:hypothetical protein